MIFCSDNMLAQSYFGSFSFSFSQLWDLVTLTQNYLNLLISCVKDGKLTTPAVLQDMFNFTSAIRLTVFCFIQVKEDCWYTVFRDGTELRYLFHSLGCLYGRWDHHLLVDWLSNPHWMFGEYLIRERCFSSCHERGTKKKIMSPYEFFFKVHMTSVWG